MRLAALALAATFALAPFPAPVLAQNLVANPALVRDLPPPGWLADRRADWVANHAVYQSACQTPGVSREIEFLNRIVGRDEDLLVLAGNPPEGNSPQAREAQLASQEMDMLRNDIAAADGLVAQLQAMPACSPAAAKAAAAPAAAPAPEPPATSSPAATVPAATSPPATPIAPEPAVAPPIPVAPAAATPSPDAAQTVTLRFDDKVFGLTPLSIRAFNKAVDAIHGGADVRLAIDGCDASADFSKDSPCAKRLASVKKLLAEKDITNWKRVLGEHP